MTDLLKKYNFYIDNGKHCYIENLTIRDINLECTTPISISILNHKIENGSWSTISVLLCEYLFGLFPNKKDLAVLFKTTWSKKEIFTFNKKVNYKLLSNGLYLCCNNDAIHACWLIQDIIKFFDISIDNVTLIIHRPPHSEPTEVKNYFKNKHTELFKKLLFKIYGIHSERALKIIDNINYLSDKLLKLISKSYDDFFLFEDKQTFLIYKNKLIDYAKNKWDQTTKTFSQIERYLTYLTTLYSIL